MTQDNKQFFVPGMKVKCTKINNAPDMYVIKKKEYTIKDGDSNVKTLQGIVCRYLDDTGVFHDEIFSTKDIEPIN